MTRTFHKFLIVLLVALWSEAACGQQVLLDRGVKVADLWCFPLVTNTNEYVYIPNTSRLATSKDGGPQCSFVRYVMARPSGTAKEGAATITAAAGGGILHFLVLYETPEDVVRAAQSALREQFKNNDLMLRGPIVFDEGRYLLVSSILDPGTGEKKKKLIAEGKAPVLEGNRIALSFDLDPEKTMLLTESFKMATPDISIVFEMAFHGLSESYDAELYIDWSEVRKSKGFSAGGTVYFISADVDIMLDELFRNNAVRLVSRGDDATMEALLNNVYTKLLELLFRPVEPERLPREQRGGLADAIGALIDQRGGALASRKTTGFGAYVGFQLKETQSSGTSVLNFNHRSSLSRGTFITFNIGDLYARYGSDSRYFRDVSLDDPTFLQRTVQVRVDGSLLGDFDKFVNSVTVMMRKTYPDGSDTVGELVIDSNNFDNKDKLFTMVYGWKGGQGGPAQKLAWLTYLYRTTWSFKGGGHYQTEWTQADAPMINLFAPYEQSAVQLDGDPETLKNKGVRAVITEIEYPFFGEVKKPRIIYRPEQSLEDKYVGITLPLGQHEYNYTITWVLQGDKRIKKEGKDSTGMIFIDEIPPT